MKSRLVAVVSWILVLAGGSAPAAPPRGAGESRFDLVAAAARLDALHISIAGDLAELRATQLLNYHRVEGGTAECMRAHGRPYNKLPYADFYRDFTDADLGYGNGRATIVDSLTAGTRRFELNEYAGVHLRQAGVTDDVPVRPEDVGVLNGCRSPYEYRSYLDVDPPAGAYELAAFEDMLAPVYRDRTVVDAWRGYDDCMRSRHGYDVGDDRSDFLFAWRFEGVPDSPEWRRGLAEMKAIFAADVDCRRPAYTAAMRLVDQRLDAWKEKHRSELLAIRREWRNRVAAAAKLPR
ncbi:hypothetical protein FB565_006802 [Actinoplanes lutulentus]|uniref:Uncharacterized protein n=1 Tax=Actinoplanes lutulentus TaxID=1287878 RepID=A0A327Z5Z3_9ACTN|nr:hypothetical protein [Actinoplanes lutulentus]MBB2947034.1 hypothetical protein [Actinoplanes lutulentus]RAK30533.1 hypothetical protein B0I29_116192 [Actinoplanes lutulentus]